MIKKDPPLSATRPRPHCATQPRTPDQAQTNTKDHAMTNTNIAQTEADRQSMIETFEAWRDGAEPFHDTWATDMVWRLEGHSIASRDYASKHEYLEEFVKPFGARFLPSQRFRPTNIRSVHADRDAVIVLWDGRGIAIDGKPYENTYAFFMQMRGGKVVDVTALTDSISLNELLERVQPAAHLDS
jgi:ketosteroid isomerase-like protein